MTPIDYDYLRNFLKVRSGLALSNEKQYLIESRLMPVARKAGLDSIAALVVALRNPDPGLETSVVEAMTTNESFFFRDKTPFEHLRDTVLPALMQARSATRKLRIWCAAASTGQEPYSVAICLTEMKSQLAGWSVDILATDLSGEVIERAKAGRYSQFEAQRGLPIQQLLKYFTKAADQWEIAPELRKMVQFRTLNLLRDFSTLGTFDVVFCRNVLIYFDQPTKVATLERIAAVTAGDGYLLLGAAETVVGLTSRFRPVPTKRGLYSPVPEPVPKFARIGA